jgi:hypothetical protein
VTLPADPVARLRRLQQLNSRLSNTVYLVTSSLPELEELEELVPSAIEHEKPSPEMAGLLGELLVVLGAVRAFVKAATARPDSAAAAAAVSDGERGGVLPDRGR